MASNPMLVAIRIGNNNQQRDCSAPLGWAVKQQPGEEMMTQPQNSNTIARLEKQGDEIVAPTLPSAQDPNPSQTTQGETIMNHMKRTLGAIAAFALAVAVSAHGAEVLKPQIGEPAYVRG